jgi:hypothetical protein
MKPLTRKFYEIPTEEEMDEAIEKHKKKTGLKWRRVEYAYAEGKMRGQCKICSMRLGTSSKYKLARVCNGLWNEIAPPANSSWESAKDAEGNEFIRMCRFGSAISNVVRITKT